MKKHLILPVFALSLGLLSCGGEKKTEDTAGEAGSATTSEAPAGDAAHGAQIYAQTCSPCHGAGGKGDGPAAATLNPKPADHTSKDVMGKLSNDDLFKIIKMGGGVVGKPTMPASPQLSDQDVRDVIAHLRTLSGT